MLLFRTPTPTEVTITVRGKEAAGDFRHTFPAGTEHILPVYGLYAGYDNTVEIRTANGRGSAVTITTPPLRPDVVAATSIKTTPEYFGQNLMFLTSPTAYMPIRNSHPMAVGLDYAGDVRWHSSVPLSWDIKRMPNGHILMGTERLVRVPYFTTGLYEMALSGKIFKEYRIGSGLHHDHFIMEDGRFLALTFDAHAHTVEDMCALVDPETGEILKTWDYKTVLPQNVAGSGSQEPHDWFHNNAVWHDSKTNSLTLSGRHQDAVINLDFDTGKLNWIIGDPEGWPEEMQKYFFKPVGGGEFDWQYEQHACVVLPDGDVMMLDNGHFRSKNKEKWILNRDNFSRGVRYRIDTEKMTIQQVWQYGKERGAEFFSPYISNVEYYDEGHYMIHSGGIAYENGEPAEGMAIMKLMDPAFKDANIELRAITVEVKDDEVVYEMQIEGNYYRAEKLPLYYAHEVAELGLGQILGTLVDTPTTTDEIEATETGETVPEQYQAAIVEEPDRFRFSATYTAGEAAQLLLVDEAGKTRRYAIKTEPQIPNNPVAKVQTIVNKTDLAGRQVVRAACRREGVRDRSHHNRGLGEPDRSLAESLCRGGRDPWPVVPSAGAKHRPRARPPGARWALTFLLCAEAGARQEAMMSSEHENRCRLAVQRLVERGADFLLVTPSTDMLYLCGYAGEPSERLIALLLGAGGPTVVTPRFEAERLARAAPFAALAAWGETEDPVARVAALVRAAGRPRPVVAVGEHTWAGLAAGAAAGPAGGALRTGAAAAGRAAPDQVAGRGGTAAHGGPTQRRGLGSLAGAAARRTQRARGGRAAGRRDARAPAWSRSTSSSSPAAPTPPCRTTSRASAGWRRATPWCSTSAAPTSTTSRT